MSQISRPELASERCRLTHDATRVEVDALLRERKYMQAGEALHRLAFHEDWRAGEQ